MAGVAVLLARETTALLLGEGAAEEFRAELSAPEVADAVDPWRRGSAATSLT